MIPAEIPSLEGLVGQEVGIMMRAFNPTTTTRATIISVEHAGLWLVIPTWTEDALELAGVTALPRRLALFVPFGQIQFVVGFYDVPSLSEKSLL